MTDQPRLKYRVTCYSTLLYRTEFEVVAGSEQQAIDFASQRTDGMGGYLEPVHEKFLETLDEHDFAAYPIG